ncbi:nucleotide disphospho-sugar-binding domain-containing protein [Sphingomonas sp. KC8]|uniref:nucleotide disphospho-sugar-binding domain-containing protein n=1 Tax=Sphingomonas sp. KC8 TaxID=1030157 RepID=UPI000248A7EA|nr:nucleotide disphospho-sugar-binding domain-containing protein [Sphingomonas sp. KC8]ARS27032.1 glycosyl transferase-like UDP-glucuronosyltransferase [Sphingomonas sp. KC8]
MARILIGWELGSGSGHTLKLIDIAAELRRRGHEPILAVQQTGAMPADYPLWQAPLWPALITTRRRNATASPSTYGDILVALGLMEPGAVSGLLRGWEAIFAAVRPDAVIAEFAPALMLAARGRAPLLAIGSGFGLPPATLPAFPSLTGAGAVQDERRALAHLNRELAVAGLPAIGALPAIFHADRTLVQAFRELDPYRPWRPAGDYASPHMTEGAAIADGRGEEVFVYLNGQRPGLEGLLGGLAGCGLPVRLHDPLIAEADIAILERAGLTFERQRVPFARIAERSRMIIGYGGLGLASAALCAGVPQMIFPFDIEKRMTAAALEEAGLGLRVELAGMDRAAIAALLIKAFADDALAARAIAAAPGFRARAAVPCAQATADAVDELLAA